MKRNWFLLGMLILTLSFTIFGCDVNGGIKNGNGEYTVTFNLEGGKIGENTANVTRTVKSGETVSDLPIAIKDGYDFDGWFSQKNGEGTQFTTTTIVTGNLNVFAKWISDNGNNTISIPTEGRLTVTGIPAKYNGKYMFTPQGGWMIDGDIEIYAAANVEKANIGGFTNLFTIVKCGLIDNGSVTLNVWELKATRDDVNYTLNDVVNFNKSITARIILGIIDTEIFTDDMMETGIAAFGELDEINFLNGIANGTTTFHDANESSIENILPLNWRTLDVNGWNEWYTEMGFYEDDYDEELHMDIEIFIFENMVELIEDGLVFWGLIIKRPFLLNNEKTEMSINIYGQGYSPDDPDCPKFILQNDENKGEFPVGKWINGDDYFLFTVDNFTQYLWGGTFERNSKYRIDGDVLVYGYIQN